MIQVGEDFVFQRDGVTVLVDDVSLPFLLGSELDYVVEMIRSAFQVVNNPNVDLACGCGTSFSKKSS
jgi:iron-sulfur cluster assembly accessory protein